MERSPGLGDLRRWRMPRWSARRTSSPARPSAPPRPTGDGTTRTYLLAGLLRCRLCGRRMDSHWVNDRPGYRCRHGRTSATRPDVDHPKNLYVREDHVLAHLARGLSPAGAAEIRKTRLGTCDRVTKWSSMTVYAAGSATRTPPTPHVRKVNRRCGNSRPNAKTFHGVLTCPRIDTDQCPTVCQPIYDYRTAIASAEAARDDVTRAAFACGASPC
jgi:recombinase-like zinc beta ribbon protein